MLQALQLAKDEKYSTRSSASQNTLGMERLKLSSTCYMQLDGRYVCIFITAIHLLSGDPPTAPDRHDTSYKGWQSNSQANCVDAALVCIVVMKQSCNATCQ